MKHSGLSRAIVAIAMMLIGWLPSLAHDFEVDGIFYNKTSDNTVAVTYKGDSFTSYSNEYAGNVVIPSSVNYNGTTYSVTSIVNYAFFNCYSLTSIEIPNSVISIGYFAFSHCSSLTSIQIPNSVTSIGVTAFEYCESLTSIVVDAGNTKYDSRNGCNAIIETASNTLIAGCKNTIISNSITGIGKSAFSGCSGLTSIEIPNSVTTIGDGTFSGCSGLTSIVVVTGNTKYDSRNGCNAIIETASNTLIAGCKNTIISNSITGIGKSAFSGCSGLTSIEIPNSVTSIGDGAFSGCSSLTDVVIGNSVTYIGWQVFFLCSNLTKITCLATTPPTIKSGSFSNSNYNAYLYVPAGCKEAYEAAEYWNNFTNFIELEPELEEGATFEYEGLTYKVIVKGEELAVIASENGKYSGDIVIPSSVDYNGTTYSVTSIGDYAFANCDGLTSIEIPNSVTSIGDWAFVGCYKLTGIEIPNSVTSIGYYAFRYCSGLTSIEIPNSVTSIGDEAFRYCSGLTDVVIGNSVTSIGDRAFSETGLTSVEIPNSVSQIGIAAFSFNNYLSHISVESGNQVYDSRENCNAIIETSSNKLIAGCKNSKILNSITTIGDRSFAGCNEITFIAIPNTVTNIELGAFGYCENLTNIEIPNSVIEIGESVFESCKSLTTIEIPNSVTEIKKRLFYGCRNLTNVVIPNSVNTIGRFAFAECYSLTSIEIPNLATSIDSSVFENCTNLANIVVGSGNPKYDSRNGCNAIIETASNTLIIGCQNTIIPNDVASIEEYAFFNCINLANIEIPNSVTSIGNSAFYNCDNLTKITCLAITPPTIKSSTFTNYSADLYVPAGCKEAYEAAEYWNKFTNIIEIEEPNVNLFIDDFAINAGETKELVINLTNEIAFTGFQADLYLPDGLEIEQEEGDYIFELTDRKGSDHVITSGKQANGAIRILCFSTNLNEFSGSEGAIVKFRVTAANDFVGNYEINIKDIILAQTDESECQLPATTTKVEARMLAKSITLDRTEVSLEATQTTTLLATILPDNTSVKTVVWTSSDEDVAVVDKNGVVTAIAIGEATITATTTDGTNLSASCKVTVVPTLGDANNDAVINVTDIMVVASYILGNTPEGFVFEAADVTKDGKINIIDIVAIANIILSSETPDKTQLAARVARQTALGSRLFIDDTSIQEGETMQLVVNLTNDIAFSGFQADVKLPEGLELCQEDGEYMISLSDRKGSDHVLTSAMLPDGTIRILSYSMNLNDFAGADGALVYLTVKANQHFVGDYEISIDNITFTQADLTEYSLEPTVCRIAGTVGIEGIEAEQDAEYFNLQGLPVANPEKGGLYIIKRGNKVSKSIIK